MVVLDKFQGLGLGKQILEKLFSKAKGKEAKSIIYVHLKLDFLLKFCQINFKQRLQVFFLK